MLLIKYENDVVPHSGVCPTKWDVMARGCYSMVSEPSFNAELG
jgi:hypothetical protein